MKCLFCKYYCTDTNFCRKAEGIVDERFAKFCGGREMLEGKKTKADIKNLFYGKSCIVVGNAQWVLTHPNRKKIDDFDIVIRFNWGCHPELGKKCTIWSTAIASKDANRNLYIHLPDEPKIVFRLNPHPDCYDDEIYQDKLFVMEQHDFETAKAEVGHEPSSGALCVWLLNHLGIKPTIFGFDGFQSRSHYHHSNTAELVHHGKKEADFILRSDVEVL